MEKEKILRVLAEKEKRHREYWRLRYVLKPKVAGVVPEVRVRRGVTSVDHMWMTLKENREELEDWETITGREEVEEILIQWNRRHFSQASETPLAKGKWERDLDVNNKENKVCQILEGRTEDLDIDVLECVEWIESLKKRRWRRMN